MLHSDSPRLLFAIGGYGNGSSSYRIWIDQHTHPVLKHWYMDRLSTYRRIGKRLRSANGIYHIYTIYYNVFY